MVQCLDTAHFTMINNVKRQKDGSAIAAAGNQKRM